MKKKTVKSPAEGNVIDEKALIGKWRWLQGSPDRKKVAAIVKKKIYADAKRSKSPGTVTIRHYKKPISLQMTHIFDKRAARLWKKKPVIKEFFDQVPPHRQKQIAMKEKPTKKGYFVSEYQRQEQESIKRIGAAAALKYPELAKAYVDAAPEKTGLKVVTQQPPPKANVCDGKWGMGEWHWKETPVALGFEKVPKGHGYFIPIDGVMVQHVLIQKKHLDEANEALTLALKRLSSIKAFQMTTTFRTWMKICRGIEGIEQALKNISVK